MSLPNNYPIEGNKISENLFYFLWAKDDMEKYEISNKFYIEVQNYIFQIQ